MSNTLTDHCDAWNPGLNSTIPQSLNPLITLYRNENAFVDYAEAQELADFCGLRPAELIALRPERLLIHELLIRVSTDLSVPDGPAYEDLGINLRLMVKTIYDTEIRSAMPALIKEFESCNDKATSFIEDQLSEQIFKRPNKSNQQKQPVKNHWWQRLFGSKTPDKKGTVSTQAPELTALAHWRNQQSEASDPFEKSCFKALVNVVGAIVGHRGKILPDPVLITKLATNQVCNQHGSAILGKLIEPLIKTAALREGYTYLPIQSSPVIMNVKGASASGKSTIRPQQTYLAERLGIPWQDFALISPDYWRKYLLDYDTLDENYKYAAMLTGQELEIIDRKLDRYMAEKAKAGEISHLLIDRFRFDSFTVDSGGSMDSRLLSRFGEQIFMFFMVTPPAETVSRAWSRGKTTGRYKAVDDLLYHNVEAFTGMPALFFSWILSDEKKLRFEFLDNDVPLGQKPKTAAFGWNNTLTILDIDLMLNIDLYRKVNIEASAPDDIFSDSDRDTLANTNFLIRCLTEIRDVTIADQNTAAIYARFKAGLLVECNHEYLNTLPAAHNLKVILEAISQKPGSSTATLTDESVINIEKQKHYTLGAWG